MAAALVWRSIGRLGRSAKCVWRLRVAQEKPRPVAEPGRDLDVSRVLPGLADENETGAPFGEVTVTPEGRNLLHVFLPARPKDVAAPAINAVAPGSGMGAKASISCSREPCIEPACLRVIVGQRLRRRVHQAERSGQEKQEAAGHARCPESIRKECHERKDQNSLCVPGVPCG